MKYVALLRGINVGGNSIIKMADLKEAVEECGFTNVLTYIQSGNVIFESNSADAAEITKKLEECLLQSFRLPVRVILLSYPQLQKVVQDVPAAWKRHNDLRCYIAFIKTPSTPQKILQEVETHEGIDFVETGPSVLYMSTTLSGLTKSKFSKLSQKKIYKEITIRNYNTTQKILSLMEQTI